MELEKKKSFINKKIDNIKTFYNNSPRYSIKDFKLFLWTLRLAGLLGKGLCFRIYQIFIVVLMLFFIVMNLLFKQMSISIMTWTIYLGFFILLACFCMYYYKKQHLRYVLKSDMIPECKYQIIRKNVEKANLLISIIFCLSLIVDIILIITDSKSKDDNVLTYFTTHGSFLWYLALIATSIVWFYTYVHTLVAVITFYLVMSIHRMEYRYFIDTLKQEIVNQQVVDLHRKFKKTIINTNSYFELIIFLGILFGVVRICLELSMYLIDHLPVHIYWILMSIVVLFLTLYNISLFNDINDKVVQNIYYNHESITTDIEYLCKTLELNPINFTLIKVVITSNILGKLILFVVNIMIGVLIAMMEY